MRIILWGALGPSGVAELWKIGSLMESSSRPGHQGKQGQQGCPHQATAALLCAPFFPLPPHPVPYKHSPPPLATYGLVPDSS